MIRLYYSSKNPAPQPSLPSEFSSCHNALAKLQNILDTRAFFVKKLVKIVFRKFSELQKRLEQDLSGLS